MTEIKGRIGARAAVGNRDILLSFTPEEEGRERLGHMYMVVPTEDGGTVTRYLSTPKRPGTCRLLHALNALKRCLDGAGADPDELETRAHQPGVPRSSFLAVGGR